MSIEKEADRGTAMMPGGATPEAKEAQQKGAQVSTGEGHVDPPKKPFYGKTTDPESLYDKRRIIDEG